MGFRDTNGGTDSTAPEQSNPKNGFEEILVFVQDELGFATEYYNEDYLNRRITARLHRTNDEGFGDYLDTLRADPDEQASLLDSLSINVTSFFRNPEMWTALKPVLQTITSERGECKLWSAPCSDGREPYSLAMLALDDPKIDTSRLRITGSDISEDAIAAARRGCYQTTNTTDIAEELALIENYREYVHRDGDRFEVDDCVRNLVTFIQHDLIHDRPPAEFDLVMCRNLLIYISPEYKEPIIETLDTALGSGGYLVIGMTETLPRSFSSRYEPVEKGTRIHRQVN